MVPCLCCIATMISIPTVIQTHLQTQVDSVVSGTNGFINFLISFHGNTRWETQFLLCWPHPYAQRILWCLRSLSVEIWKTFNGQNPTHSLNGPISTDIFSKFSNSQDQLFRVWRHPHSSPISCLGFIWQMVIFISFAHECKTATNDSNSSKPYQTEW